jgi:hypothetical protein
MGEQWLWHVQQLLLLWSMDDLHWGLCMRVVKGVSDPISKFQSPDLGRSYTYSTKFSSRLLMRNLQAALLFFLSYLSNLDATVLEVVIAWSSVNLACSITTKMISFCVSGSIR